MIKQPKEPMNHAAAFEKSSFVSHLAEHQVSEDRGATLTLQANLGRLCNQVCDHCHQGAGPTRKELMDKSTILELLGLIKKTPSIRTLDLTGGAPELNPHFRFFVEQARSLGLQVIDRCNLTVLFEPGQEDTAAWLAKNQVQVVASLPCYGKKNVDQQRGDGVFEQSIQGLQLLNSLGYGQGDLDLNLVYNPAGPSLPPDQAKLEADYREKLQADFGIKFTGLYTITNMPIRRFKGFLQQSGQVESYRQLLQENFNPGAAEAVMCKSTVSVDFQGRVYDCDFNQAMDFGALEPQVSGREDFDLTGQPIRFGDHCFGCTAGAGSSCGGALALEE